MFFRDLSSTPFQIDGEHYECAAFPKHVHHPGAVTWIRHYFDDVSGRDCGDCKLAVQIVSSQRRNFEC